MPRRASSSDDGPGEKAGANAIYKLKLEESDFMTTILKGQMWKRWLS